MDCMRDPVNSESLSVVCTGWWLVSAQSVSVPVCQCASVKVGGGDGYLFLFALSSTVLPSSTMHSCTRVFPPRGTYKLLRSVVDRGGEVTDTLTLTNATHTHTLVLCHSWSLRAAGPADLHQYVAVYQR